MRRRDFLKAAPALMAPALAHAQGRPLRYIPNAGLSTIDPIWTTALVAGIHGYMVFDTLYGQDGSFTPQPQMLEGHVAEANNTVWTLTLRDGLRFHDNAPVLARDAVASIRRWAKRDVFGAALMDATDELSALSDKAIRFRLKRPFALLPEALAKIPPCMPCIMPERLAQTDPFTQVTEVIGTEGEVVITQDLISYEITGEDETGRLRGKHVGTGIVRPNFWERARYYNLERELADALDKVNQ